MSLAIDTRHTPLGAREKTKLLSFYKAMANPIRVNIVDLLLTQGELRPTDIAILLGEPQANVSYHLGVMHEKGHLTKKECGREVFYDVAPTTAATAEAVLAASED